jgi:catalase (peroxidase I)
MLSSSFSAPRTPGYGISPSIESQQSARSWTWVIIKEFCLALSSCHILKVQGNIVLQEVQFSTESFSRV